VSVKTGLTVATGATATGLAVIISVVCFSTGATTDASG